MSKLNTIQHAYTHEGAVAKRINPVQQLRRTVMSCLLWENQFYESGQSVADRIQQLIPLVTPHQASEIAIEAREVHNLRHVPLLLAACMAKHHRGHSIVADTISRVIKRADELAEIIVIHCHINGVSPSDAKRVLSSQMKKGIAAAFQKFDEYQLAKYNRPGAVKLRDALFLSHAKPKDKKQACVFKRLAADTMKTPDTWEVALSAGGDKREEFERMLRDGKLGYMALLRNLSNMEESGVDPSLVKAALLERKGANRVLPFRFTAAARHAPRYEREIDQALCANIELQPSLSGTTVVLVDVSGSMTWAKVSEKSELTRLDAAATLGAIVNGDDVRVLTFSTQLVEVPPRKGMAGVDVIKRSQPNGGTDLGGAIRIVNEQVKHDRIIVITDEQSQSRVPDPVCDKAYMINVASYQNGVGYGKWTHIDGFSESVLKFIHEIETL